MEAKAINVNDVAKRLTMTVDLVGVKSFKVRLSIGVWLISIAAMIIGCSIKVKTDGP